MRIFRALAIRLRGLFTKAQHERDLSEELESHLQMHIDDNIRAGMTPPAARREALVQFGGVEVTKEAYRERHTLPWLEHLGQDVRYAARMMRRNPGFTFLAVGTMALGIGANAAIFTIVNGVLLRPLPLPDPDRLVSVVTQQEGGGLRLVTLPDYEEWRDQSRSFDGLAAGWNQAFNLTGVDEPERLTGAAVTTNYFAVLGAVPVLGRGFGAGDANVEVVVLSSSLWHRRFAGDREIVGRSVNLSGRSFTVIGVMPQLPLMAPADLWVPLVREPGMDRGYPVFSVTGRLQSQSSIARAEADLMAVAARAADAYPNTNKGLVVTVSTLQEAMVGATRPLILILFGAVGCVLLIACVNVAALALARSSARGHELSVRTALGASRSRILRQLLTESVVLSICGGVAGLGLAAVSLESLLTLAPLPRASEISIDAPVFLFALAASMTAGIVSGLAPALTTRHMSLRGSLSTPGTTASTFGQTVRPALLAIEVGATIVLLAGAGLLMHSFYRLQRVQTGFDGEGLLTLRFFLPNTSYDNVGRVQLFERMTAGVATLPDVENTAAVSALPFGGANGSAVFRIPGRTPPDPGDSLVADFYAATPAYFETMGVPVLEGRDFNRFDRSDSQLVAIVNRAMANQFFPGENPIGRSVQIIGPRPRTIVGIVQDIRDRRLDLAPEPHIYVPHAQFPTGVMSLVVRARAVDPARLARSVQAEIRSLDRNLPIAETRTWQQLLDQTLLWRRFPLVLLTMFAAAALLLAIVGIYGVLSFIVSQRTREIGIRMALGATRTGILTLTAWQGLGPVAIGFGIGIPAAWAATRTMQAMLFEVSPADPLAFGGALATLAIAALMATLIPANRAARVEPMAALRHE